MGPPRPDPGDTGEVRLAWSLVLIAGCFHPTPPEGAACARGTDCPDPLICDQGVCVRTPRDGAVDDGVIDAPPDVAIDADLSCTCSGGKLTCGSVNTTCTLGCMPMTVGARCLDVDPSNGVGITAAGALTTDITVNGGIATFNTDTGAISGVITRSAGQGVIANIAFELRTTGTQPIGVWTFHRFAVNGGAAVRFTGARSAVFVSGTSVAVGGTIDGTGGCAGSDVACAGPGGGVGGNAAIATGCGPGGTGAAATSAGGDGGGGGGGGRGAGAAGGLGGGDGTGGVGGGACVAANAEPLVGGSGAGAGGPGAVARCKGGGGGGALQITALESLTVSGTITLGGAGGEGGAGDPNTSNAAAGCGGGAGGTLLLEAPAATISGTLAANGGGGGGGASGANPGSPGAPGGVTATPASGGAPAGIGGAGGAGAAGATAPVVGSPSTIGNGGGGGGGIGAIYIRTSPGMLTQGGVATPVPGTGPIRTQ